MKNELKQAAHMKRSGLVAGAACVMALAVGMRAQGQESGPIATIGLSFGGEFTAEDPGEDTGSLTTALDFELSRVTDRHSFGLSADGRFVFDEEGFGFEQPGIAATYARANRSTAFDVGLSYSERDVAGTSELIDPITLEIIDLVDDDGTLESLGLNAALQTGLDARFSTDTQFGYTSRSYSGTSDPDLSDLENWRIGTTLAFEVSPRITLRTSANYRETQEDDAERTESRTTRFGLAANLQIDPLWSAALDLNYSGFETEEGVAGNRTTTENDGLGFAASLNRQFRDGALGLSFNRTVSEDGAQDSLTLFRDRTLQGGGALSWSAGLSLFPNGDVAPVVSASFVQQTPRGVLSVNLQQATAIREDDNVVTTTAGVSYDQAINAVSGWSLSGSLANVNALDGNAEDQSRMTVGLSYNRDLTEDWAFSTSVRHRVLYQAGEQDSSESVLSLSLQRSFSFRP
jgi:hypothetical protein